MNTSVKGFNWKYEDFFQDIITQVKAGRSVFIQAHGWSMLPLLWDKRDKLELSPLQPDSISLSRILLFQDPRTKYYIIHRLVAIEKDTLVFRGDGNPYQYERCKREHILAEIRMVIRNGKEVHIGDSLWKNIERYWPKGGLTRRLAVGVYRRLFIGKRYHEQ